MLGKLLKYEFRATGRLFLPLYGALVIFALINALLLSFREIPQLPAVLAMLVYILLAIAVFVVTFIVMIQRFYKNLLSDEGYLMFTLPVKAWCHILCKLIVSTVWLIVSIAITLFTIFIMMFNANLFRATVELWNIVMADLLPYLGPREYLMIAEFLATMFISIIGSILAIYTAISLGHLFRRHRILAAFGAYIVLSIVESLLSEIIYGVFGTFTMLESDAAITMQGAWVFHQIMFPGLVVTIISIIACFIVTNFILSHKLNLE